MLLNQKNRTQTKHIYRGNILSFRLDSLRLPTGKEITREIIEHNGGVVIAARPNPVEVILVEQYRYCIDEVLFELPAGRVEVGERPEVCAARELIEETGYRASKWKELANMYSAPGFCTELLHAYEASDLEFVGANPDEDEEIEIHTIPLSTAWEWVTTGKIRDAKTIAVLGMLHSTHAPNPNPK